MERQQISRTGDQQNESSHPGRSKVAQSHSLHPIHQLRGALGNRAFGRFIQTKLTVSEPGDAFEQEADRVADAVVAGQSVPVGHVSQGVQRKLYRMEMRPEDMVDSMPAPGDEFGPAAPETNPTEEVQRSSIGEAGGVTQHFEQSLQQATSGGGAALSPSTRSLMESRFGRDFSSVRIHNDANANTLARHVNARAFTLDRNIFFAGSEYQPDSTEGQRLLAHELTHVVQQSTGQISRQIQRRTSCSSYPGVTGAALNTYNCAGLATRTYQFIAPASATYDSIAANFNAPGSPGAAGCGAGVVKFWLWQYDLHFEDDQGTQLSTPSPDFHVVAGRCDSNGADPNDVFSKNGRRPVHGPGTGPSFQPSARDRNLTNDANEAPVTRNGRPVFSVRTNMSEEITCGGCYP